MQSLQTDIVKISMMWKRKFTPEIFFREIKNSCGEEHAR